MRTINTAQTRSISIAARPDAVHSYLSDGRNLPKWAPGFAPAVRPDGASWVVQTGGGEFSVDLLANGAAGTVDVVSADDHSRGLFCRVLPNGDGSELLFTLFFAPATAGQEIDAQVSTLAEELAAVKAACE